MLRRLTIAHQCQLSIPKVDAVLCGHVQCIRYARQQLWLYEAAHRVLAAQGIPRAPSGNPFARDAPWKREDLHRVGQDDCEKLGGIFYFRILWFNVSPTLAGQSTCIPILRPMRKHQAGFTCLILQPARLTMRKGCYA